jgi:hypothetical protein
MDDKQPSVSNLTIKEIFDLTIDQCKRVSTKEGSLNADLSKDILLVKALQQCTQVYGINITSQFQAAYEAKNPALSFLFAQISNFILEKAFHVGSCQLQADVALFEFCKKGIFNVSIICSNPTNALIDHWYLMILDDHTFRASTQWPKVYAAIRPNGFSKTSLYFDTWSKQLCEWKNFKPDPENKYQKNLKEITQAMFKPLINLFKDEVNLIETIIWCLTEYEKCLKNIKLAEEKIPMEYTRLFTTAEDEFQREVKFLFDSQQCMLQLLTSIEIEKKAFQERLVAIKHVSKKQEKEDSVNDKDIKLDNITSAFFKQNIPTRWKEYPQQLVSQHPTYAGHQIRFFTLPQNDTTTQRLATDFTQHLREKGLSAEQRDAKGKPSIIVDLTTSSFTI